MRRQSLLLTADYVNKECSMECIGTDFPFNSSTKLKCFAWEDCWALNIVSECPCFATYMLYSIQLICIAPNHFILRHKCKYTTKHHTIIKSNSSSFKFMFSNLLLSHYFIQQLSPLQNVDNHIPLKFSVIILQ